MGDRTPCAGSRRPSKAAVGTHAKIGNVLLCIGYSASRALDPIYDIDQAQEELGLKLPLEPSERLHVGSRMFRNDRKMNIIDTTCHSLENCVRDVDEVGIVLASARVMMPDRADVKA